MAEQPQDADTLAATGVAATRLPSSSGSGEVLAGRYQLLEMLGSGGMGTVYRAHDLELDEVVALKTLRHELIAAPGAIDRFRRELKLARRVTHRSVARAYDLGEHAGERFLTMELIEGPSFGRVLAERTSIPAAEAVRIGIGIAEGLAAAHAAGVVHRDLKPDNVLLEGERVVITDFGVARAMSSDDVRATALGGLVGTPAYMAPEQVTGGEVDARSDVYALGILLFEAISGRLPFEGKSALAVAAARLLGDPPKLATFAPSCPSGLAELVDRALARAPADRFESATAIRDALMAVQAQLESSDSTPGRENRGTQLRTDTSPPMRAIERRVAVVPLRNAGSSDDAWLAEGLADDLVDSLSLVGGVRVRARAPAPARDGDLRAYGRDLDVEVVLEGSVRREAERICTHLRLVSIEDGFQIWARRFDSSVGELLRIGEVAAQAIAEALAGAELHPRPRPTPAPEAVELYLRAKRDQGAWLGSSIDLLERALAIAPDDPTILAAFAQHAADWAFQPAGEPMMGERARDAACRALAIAPDLATAHVALARVHNAADQDREAMTEVLEARRCGPGLAEPDDLLGRYLADCDLLAEARAHLERALWIDPRPGQFAQVDLARIAAFEGRFDDCVEMLQSIRSASPQLYTVAAGRMHLWGAPIEFPTSEFAPSHQIAFFDSGLRAVALEGRLAPTFDAELERVCSHLPAKSRPQRLWRQLEAESRARTGDPAGALAGVRRAVDAGLRDLAWMRRCPLLGEVRQLPGFAELLGEVEARVQPRIDLYRAARVPIALASPHA